jgi:hypothetical protein
MVQRVVLRLGQDVEAEVRLHERRVRDRDAFEGSLR